MKTILFATVFLISGLAQAATLAQEVRADKTMDSKIYRALKNELKVQRLSGEHVFWNTLKCHSVVTSELSGQGGGVCTVTAGALQVGAQIAIVKAASGTSVKVIYADIE
jgi:hypothetical protein